MIIALLALNCLADVRVHEQDLADSLPGNKSHIHFTECIGESVGSGGVVNGKGKWKASQVNQLGTIWSYSGDFFVHVDVDVNCKVKNVKVWTKPENQMLEPLLQQAEEAIHDKFDDLLESRPDYQVVCGRGAT